MSRTRLILISLLTQVYLQACNAPLMLTEEPLPSAPPEKSVGAIIYKDATYGFSITLPQSWEGYIVTSDTWNGYTQDELKGDVIIEQGPLIRIQHPDSNPEHPRQDIPIMVFTIPQWEGLQGGSWWVGAAPIGPSELARNNLYVFALPARYNYAFLEGWEEVEQILQKQPIQTFNLDQP